MTLHFLNDVANDPESTHKTENYVIIASLKGETIGKQIYRIQGSRLLISSYQARRSHVNKRSQNLGW